MISNSISVRRLSRRSLLRSASAAGVAVAAGHIATPGATRASGTGLTSFSRFSASLAANDSLSWPGDQLAWFVDSVNAGGTGISEEDVAAHVAPGLLAVLPTPQIIGTMQALAAGYGAMTLQGATRPPTESQAVGLVSTTAGIQLALPITIEDAAPHRITGMTFYPSPSGDGTPLQPLPMMTEPGTIASRVDVGGREIYFSDVGSGGPTVVFEAGLGDSGAVWSGIIPAIAADTRVVSYDRPNTAASASDPAPAPRTAADAVSDLHMFLEQATVPGPYVLVGHSVGGLFTRLFASHYPNEVAGMVLVDAAHEEQDVRRQEMVSADLFAAEQQAVQGNTEGIDLETSFTQVREVRAAAPLSAMPLVVLSAGQIEPARYPEGWPIDEEAQLHNELQEDLAALVRGGRRVVAEEGGHYIQQSQPDLVVEAIRDVVRAVRDPDSWTHHVG